MSAILIEKVQNGFLVRPFQACPGWPVEDQPIFVYFTVEQLSADLANLINTYYGEPTNSTTGTQPV